MGFFKKLPLFIVILGLVNCDSLEHEFVDNDNIPAENADPTLLINNIQLETRSLFFETSFFGGEFTRMNYMYGDTYANAVAPGIFNRMYEAAYSDIFSEANTLFEIAEERNLYVHLGIAKILKAYTMITLVDYFGDMPYSDELDGTVLNPQLEDDEVIYTKALELLNEAIIDLENPLNRATPEFDFFYDTNEDTQIDPWIRVANTIKFKAYLNMHDDEGINDLMKENRLITDPENDFQFNYSSYSDDPDSRHPNYSTNYSYDYGYVDYLSISYINMLLTDKEIIDPRINYYYYRQSVNTSYDVNLTMCNFYAPAHFDADDPYCVLPFGYTGQNHLNDPGLNCNSMGTTFGVYPAGGQFDEGVGGLREEGYGLGGAGIEPILLSSFTHFMIAEAELTVRNNENNARGALGTAIEHSFRKVAEFGHDFASDTEFEITDSTITNYTSIVLDRFDNAPDESEKLRIIAREYYFALWGNGYEAYNLMRRTGFPDRDDNLQPARSPNPGNWPRSVLYPSSMIDRNDNIEQKPAYEFLIGPFWDPNKRSTKFNF